MSKEMTLEQFENYLSKTPNSIQSKLEKSISLCCEKVRSDIQSSMAHTERELSITYKNGHHPSKPGNPPAPDTGNLRNSIRYEVHGQGKEVYGIVGSTQKEPDYATWTEYGTSKMAPRPWLRPNMLKNESWIKKSLAKAVADGISEVKK